MLFNHATFLQKFDFSCPKSWFWSDPIQTYKTVETLFFAFPKVDFLDKNEDLEQCARLVQIEQNTFMMSVFQDWFQALAMTISQSNGLEPCQACFGNCQWSMSVASFSVLESFSLKMAKSIQLSTKTTTI